MTETTVANIPTIVAAVNKEHQKMVG